MLNVWTVILVFKLFSEVSSDTGDPPFVSSQKSSDTKIIAGGSSVTLKCPVEGADGLVLYRWYKDGEELSEPLYPEFKFVRNQRRKLHITNFSSDIAGKFMCKGVNGFGHAKFTFHLYLGDNSIPDIPATDVLADGVLTNMTAVEGDTVTLSCKVLSLEMWSVRWFKMVESDHPFILEDIRKKPFIEIEDQIFRQLFPSDWVIMSEKFLPDGNYKHSLSFVSARTLDSGQYVCAVFTKGNLLSHSSAHLTVQSPLYQEDTDNKKSPILNLTVVLGVLGSIVLVLLAILFFLLCNTPNNKKKYNLPPAQKQFQEHQKIRFDLNPEVHNY